MVLYIMVYGTVWYMVHYSMVQYYIIILKASYAPAIPYYGTVWYDAAWYCTVWDGTVWYDAVWYCTVWDGTVWYDAVWYCTVRYS